METLVEIKNRKLGKTATVSHRKQPRRLTFAKIDSMDNGNSYHTALHFKLFHYVPLRRRHFRPGREAVSQTGEKMPDCRT